MRGYNMSDFSNAWDIYKNPKYQYLYNDYNPTENDIKIITQRINERLNNIK
jgi:hypothetical protein